MADPTKAQLDARLNPQAFTAYAPQEGLFRGVGDFGATLYKRSGNKIEAFDIAALGKQYLETQLTKDQYGNYAGMPNTGGQAQEGLRILKEKYGIDWSSLAQQNMADISTIAGKEGLQVYRSPGPEGGVPNFVFPNQDINAFAKITPSAGGTPYQFNTTPNALATPEQLAKAQTATNTQLNLDPNRVINQTTGQTAAQAAAPKPTTTTATGKAPVLTPEQQNAYYASEGNKAKPLSPADWLAQTTGQMATDIQNNQTPSVFTSDPDIQSQINTLPPEIQGLVSQLTRMLEKTLEAGQVLNPDIELTPERLKEFTDQATTELEPYYQEVINQAKGDIELSLNRLSEDYKRGVSRAEEPFKEGLARQSESEAQAGLTYGSERGLRERQNVQSQQRSLDDVFRTVERGVQDTARAGERSLGSGFLSGLQSPQFSPFTASTGGFSQGTPRTIFNLQGGLMGEKPKQRGVDIRTRASELEDISRRNLILDRSNL